MISTLYGCSALPVVKVGLIGHESGNPSQDAPMGHRASSQPYQNLQLENL